MAFTKRALFNDLVRALAQALDYDEGEKLTHASRVAVLAQRLAQALHHPDPGLLYAAGLLHDVGTVGLPDHVVHAAGRGFADLESQSHPALGARLLAPFALFRPLLPIIADHHERVDGQGFPAGKRGAEVAVEASIILLADTLDVSCRQHRLAADKLNAHAAALMVARQAQAWPQAVADAGWAMLRAAPTLLPELMTDAGLEALVHELDYLPQDLDAWSEVGLTSELLWIFARVADAKHSYTALHSTRVGILAQEIARALGSGAVSGVDALWSGLVHDIGKMGVSRKLLAKSGPLTVEEWVAMRRHPDDTVQLLASVQALSHLAFPAASHHEHYDGRGYPRGLAGEEIPLMGRVLAYADAYDALTHDRAFRRAVPHAEALALLRTVAGTQLDPHLADVALAALDVAGPRLQPLPLDRLTAAEFAELWAAHGTSMPVAPFAASVAGRKAPSGVLLVDLEPWCRLRLSPAGQVLEGQAALTEVAGALVTTDFFALFDPPSQTAFREHVATLTYGQVHTRYGFSVAGRPLEVVFVRDADGLTVLCRSAANRLQSLKQMALFYRNFLSSSEAAFFTDPAGRILDANRRFLDLYGLQLRDLQNQVPHELLAPEGAGAQAFVDYWQHGRHDAAHSFWGELTTRAKSGQEVPVEFTAVAIRDANGGLVGYIGRAVDITERKRLLAELTQKNAELESLNRLKSDLVAITSHDLKAPVNAMLSYANLIRDVIGPGNAKAEQYLSRMLRSGYRMVEFINEILDLDKIEAGNLALDLKATKLYEVVASVVEEQAVWAADKQVQLSFQVHGPRRSVRGDELRLRQVVSNIVANAIKYSPRGETVSVDYHDRGGALCVTVTDRGPGIPASELEKVFDRYYQVKQKSGASYGGSGLGLDIAKRLMTLHGGRIWVENQASGGCIFSVEMPAVVVEAEAAPKALLVALADDAGTAVAAVAGPLLDRGYAVLRAGDAETAAQLLAREQPEVVFCLGTGANKRCGELCRVLCQAAETRAIGVRVGAEVDAEPTLCRAVLCPPVLEVEVAELLESVRLNARQRGKQS